MDYTNLPKQTFADLIALRQAVVALINLLPEKEKELVKKIGGIKWQVVLSYVQRRT